MNELAKIELSLFSDTFNLKDVKDINSIPKTSYLRKKSSSFNYDPLDGKIINEMNEDIIRYCRDEFNLLIGEKTAEDVKIAIGSACPQKEKKEILIRGRDLVSGLPKGVMISDTQVREALSRSIRIIVNNIKTTIEETPPELLADIMQRGIILAGGGSLIRGLDQLISNQTEMPVRMMEDPLTAVVRGTGIVLEDIDALKDVLIEDQREKSYN